MKSNLKTPRQQLLWKLGKIILYLDKRGDVNLSSVDLTEKNNSLGIDLRLELKKPAKKRG